MSALVTAIESKGSWFHGQSDRDLLDAFLVQQAAPWEGSRFVTLGESWRSCTRAEAQDVIAHFSVGSIAYGGHYPNDFIGEVAPAQFTDRFDSSARFYTNILSADFKSWMRATTTTFDAGIGAIDGASVGIFWAQDED